MVFPELPELAPNLWCSPNLRRTTLAKTAIPEILRRWGPAALAGHLRSQVQFAAGGSQREVIGRSRLEETNMPDQGTVDAVCPHCGKAYPLASTSVGRDAKCSCGRVFQLVAQPLTTEKTTIAPEPSFLSKKRKGLPLWVLGLSVIIACLGVGGYTSMILMPMGSSGELGSFERGNRGTPYWFCPVQGNRRFRGHHT